MSFRLKYLKYKKKYLELKNNYNSTNYDNQLEKAFKNNKTYVSLQNSTNDLFQNKNYASTYGELTQKGFNVILGKAKNILKINDLTGLNYVDLGSGLGKTPIMAFNAGAQKSLGIELSPERHAKAIEMHNNLKSEILAKDMERYNNVKYINGDILNNKELDKYLPSVSLVYISNLCFSPNINQSIGEKLKLLPQGALVFCSKEIKVMHLKLLGKLTVLQSWGSNQTIHFYQRL